jgi:S1-C subfamily serine protease
MSHKQSTTIIAATILAVVCIILACLAGLFVGGVGGRIAGLWAGRRTGTVLRNRLRATPAQPRGRLAYAASITTVTAGSPADDAGLAPGDLILAIDGTPIRVGSDPRQILSSHRPGDRIELTIQTAGRTRQIQVRLGEKPDEPGSPYLGISYQLTPYPSGD